MLKPIKEKKYEIILLAVLLFFAATAHSINMFHFPYYENDEGTYMSQAWSFLKEGKLAPYTYWYDHAPVGWILIAIWVMLTGGFFTFGPSVNSGRVLMLLIHVIISAILYFLARKVTNKSPLSGIIAVIAFTLSPLGLYFQRRVLLDNIMIMWALLSLALLFIHKLKLRHIFLSAVCFGIAVLTKENAIFFVPAFLYVLWFKSHTHHKSFALVSWFMVSAAIISTYFLYAILKNELFPPGFLGDTKEHVSLIETLIAQYSRGKELPFWNRESDFYTNLVGWIYTDAFLIIGGTVAMVVNALKVRRGKIHIIIPLFTLLFWLFLVRGKLVINFCIAPIIPLLALNIGIFVDHLVKQLSKIKIISPYMTTAGAIALSVLIFLFESPLAYIKDETTPQIRAIHWIKEHLAEDTRLVIDDSIYVDLHDAQYKGDKIFKNADWSWKVEKDPEIIRGKLDSDWKNIHYVVLSHEMLKQIKDDKFNFIQQALDNSSLVVEWRDKSTSFVDINNYISTNGDWMAIYKVDEKPMIELKSAWDFYKDNFIREYGQIIDKQENDKTTSEGQSYALLKAVWLNDQIAFDNVWKWTKDHLQWRTQDKLISWLWVKKDNSYSLGDSNPASDADEDIALALLFASKKWGKQNYYNDALTLINDIWKHEVEYVKGRYILTMGVNSISEGYIVNPSYCSPAWYKIFAEVDKYHDWNKLADDCYFLLDKISEKYILPPNWILVNKDLTILPAQQIMGLHSEHYGYDSFRTFWRIALDYKWNNDERAYTLLKKYEPLFKKEIVSDINLAAVYSQALIPVVTHESISTYTGPLSIFSVTDRAYAQKLFETKLFPSFKEKYWGNENNYYDQNWAWFGTALYYNKTPNLWSQKSQVAWE